VALLAQAGMAAIFIVLGQAGTTVRGAYDVLVSRGIISYFIPFLFMFAALVRVQRAPAPAGVLAVPGGPAFATVLGVLGFMTTAIAIVLAAVPAGDDPHPVLAVVKIIGLSLVMCAAGVELYAVSTRGRRSPGRPRTHQLTISLFHQFTN
jgi:hypothetical protein